MSRIILLIIASLFSLHSTAQNFFYSAPVGNVIAGHPQIIGKVKDHIIVCNYINTNVKSSQIFVYDERMRLLHKTSFKHLAPKIASVDFVKWQDSFSALLQYFDGKFFICKLVNFDADGNFVHAQTLDSADKNSEYFAGSYEIFKSPQHNSLVLLRPLFLKEGSTVEAQYYFVRNGSLKNSDKIVLPFQYNSTRFGKVFLDDDHLLIPLVDITNYRSRLSLFKIDLNNNTSINTIRENDGYLASANINITANDGYYTVTSTWENNDAHISANHKIFVWQLQKDLTDLSTDTLLAGTNIINKNFQGKPYFKLISLALNNNTANIIVSSGISTTTSSYKPGSYSAPVYNNTAYNNTVYTQGGSFYEGRVNSMTPSKELNGNGYERLANITHGPTWSNVTSNTGGYGYANSGTVSHSEIVALAVLNVNSRNNLNWTQYFNPSMEDFNSLVNESVFINVQNSLHMIYAKALENNKQALYDVIIHPDGSYAAQPIIAMDLKYTYFLDQSYADDNTLIVPCAVKGKLAFAKLEIQ